MRGTENQRYRKLQIANINALPTIATVVVILISVAYNINDRLMMAEIRRDEVLSNRGIYFNFLVKFCYFCFKYFFLGKIFFRTYLYIKTLYHLNHTLLNSSNIFFLRFVLFIR